DVLVRQRVLALGHLGLLAGAGGDLLEQEALVRLTGDDAGQFAVALLQQVGVGGHHVAAEGLGRLVAPLAVLLEERPHLVVVADGAVVLLLRLGPGNDRGHGSQEANGQQEGSNPNHAGPHRGRAAEGRRQATGRPAAGPTPTAVEAGGRTDSTAYLDRAGG